VEVTLLQSTFVSGEISEKDEAAQEEYFDEEQYSPWASKNQSVKGFRLGRIPMVFVLLGLAIITSCAALLILFMNTGNGADARQIANLEARVRQLEERLDKYEAIDEKVTRIWEQAKSFEKFKDRFDRSEASMSLRMDHLTMSLEALQKQYSQAAKAASPPASTGKKTGQENTPATESEKVQYHTVVAGDTFFNISQRYGLTVDELLKMNNLKKDSILHIGQKIIVRKGSES